MPLAAAEDEEPPCAIADAVDFALVSYRGRGAGNHSIVFDSAVFGLKYPAAQKTFLLQVLVDLLCELLDLIDIAYPVPSIPDSRFVSGRTRRLKQSLSCSLTCAYPKCRGCRATWRW